jgi:hypothetical protein
MRSWTIPDPCPAIRDTPDIGHGDVTLRPRIWAGQAARKGRREPLIVPVRISGRGDFRRKNGKNQRAGEVVPSKQVTRVRFPSPAPGRARLILLLAGRTSPVPKARQAPARANIISHRHVKPAQRQAVHRSR